MRRESWRSACAALRARPHHLGVAAAVVGLLAGPRAPAVLLAALLAALAVVRCRAPAAPATPPLPGERARAVVVACSALLAGAAVGEARLAALERTAVAQDAGRLVAARVVVQEAPRLRASGARAAVVRWRGERVLLRTPPQVAWPAGARRVGAVIVVEGRVSGLRSEERWLRPRHVHAALVATSVLPTGRRRGGLAGAVDRVRERAEAALVRAVPAEQGALLRGMVLGQDDALPTDVREAFRRTGLSHLVAASGQNVLLLAALGIGVASLAGLGVRGRALLVLALIALYVPLAGAGPSIQRAGVMGAAAVAALLAGRPAARWHALLLAAAVTLAVNPRACEEPGWQLSFAAVVALIALAPRLAAGLRRRGLARAPAEVVAVTVAATLGTAPLVALHFERTSVVALAANVLVAPAVAPAMWLGMLAGVAGQASADLAAPLSALAGWPAAYVGAVAAALARVPFAEVAAPAAAVAAGTAAAALAVVWPGARRLAAAGLGAAAVAAVAGAPAPARPPAGPRVAFLDVGQGDATLLQHGRHAVLVDAGPPGGAVVARLRAAGVRRLDVLVATHAQADHVGGAAAVLRALPVGVVLDGRDGVREANGAALAAAARARGVPVVPAVSGQVVRAGPLRLRVHWPPATPPAPGTDPNERAVVATAEVGGLRVLLPADAESDVLTRLSLPGADVLKVAHHGSADPALPRLLAGVRPRLAVIEAGRGNPYGHPSPETLAALAGAGVTVLRTDVDGTVHVTPAPDGSLRVARRR